MKLSDDELQVMKLTHGEACAEVLILREQLRVAKDALTKSSERKSPSITATTIYAYEQMVDENKETLAKLEEMEGKK